MNRRRRIFFRIAAWACLVTAGLHGLGHFAGPPPPENETEATLLNLMKTYEKNVFGAMRTTEEFLTGFSLVYSLFLAVLGVLNLVLIRHLRDDGPLMRRIAIVDLIGSAALLAISVVYFVPPPIVCAGVIVLGFALAL